MKPALVTAVANDMVQAKGTVKVQKRFNAN